MTIGINESDASCHNPSLETDVSSSAPRNTVPPRNTKIATTVAAGRPYIIQ